MCAQKPYDGLSTGTVDVAPKGNFKSDKQHSGTPGLIQRGNGKWAVKVNFTKEEQAAWLKVRRERKRYIQVSLRTDSLELARQPHPEDLLKIRKELSQVMVASGNLDQLHPTERLKYGVGRAYQVFVEGLENPSPRANGMADALGDLLARIDEMPPEQAEAAVEEVKDVLATRIVEAFQNAASGLISRQSWRLRSRESSSPATDRSSSCD